MFNLWSKLGCPKIKIVDVGAMDLGDKPFGTLPEQEGCEIIGFEADENECSRLNGQDEHKYYPYVIGDGERRVFYECNYPQTSSLYRPNTGLLEKFQLLEELTQVKSTKFVQTRRLDKLYEVDGCDFLKIDVQGADLDVLCGAVSLLKDVLVVQAEAMLVEMYIGQPLWSNIDIFLRDRGFQFHRFAPKSNRPLGRCFKPTKIPNYPYQAWSQYLWADVVYVRDFMKLFVLGPEELLKIAAIMHDVYGSYDFVHYILANYDAQTGTNKAKEYEDMSWKKKEFSALA
jgi:FkbM family methyltransferase